MNEIDNYIDQKIFRLERQRAWIDYTLKMLKELQKERKTKPLGLNNAVRQVKQYTIYDAMRNQAV